MSQAKIELTQAQALVLLKDGELGVAEWNEHFAVGHCPKALNGVDLSCAMLHNVQLANVDLSSAQLKQADLFGANLERAELGDANLREAHLSEANLADASLIQANLNLANLMGANLTKAKLSYATCVRCNFVGANLSAANLNRAELSGADLLGANLERAKLSGTDLGGANLQGADLCHADLSEANLAGADLTRANLEGARLEAANLEAATLDGACFEGAVLESTLLDHGLDLLLLEWETLHLNGVRYTRSAVESGDQALPTEQPPLRISFALKEQVTGEDLRALEGLVQSETKPKGTRVYLALTESGSQLVIEGRGSLTQAGLVGAMLFAMPGATLAVGASPDASTTPCPHPLRASLNAVASEGLLACARKLNQVYVRPRAHTELERFAQLIEQHGATNDAHVSERTVTLVRRSKATEAILLSGLGFEPLEAPTPNATVPAPSAAPAGERP